MKDHIFEPWRKIRIYDWSSQLYTQKMQAWTGFELMTSAIPVQFSGHFVSSQYTCRRWRMQMNTRNIIYNYQVLLLHGMRPYWWVVANATKCKIFCKESILSGDLKLNLLQNILKERACWKSDFPCPRLPLVSVTPYRNKKENVFYSIEEMKRIFTRV